MKAEKETKRKQQTKEDCFFGGTFVVDGGGRPKIQGYDELD
jgi:hypothetical protein